MADLDIQTQAAVLDFADGLAPLWIYALASWRFVCSINVIRGVDVHVTLPEPRDLAFPVECLD